ncbi:hypothetical protein [Actinoplanes sp. URMC 104]|uniref:hypothetical protein n=1 Tax=Actinoplanes sp. URMC 104 TaxID=3423409 RepID=UPI003F1BB49A
MNRRRIAFLAGLVTVAGVVVQATHASLSETVVNSGNSWATGAVTVTDNDHGQALFSDTALAPGTGPATCVEVTYRGDVDAEVRLYLTGLDERGQRLGTLLRLRIDIGSGASCAAPGTWILLGDATLRETAAARNWSTGLRPGLWRPRPAQTRPYRFTPTLADDNAAQGSRADFGLIWEARSR